MPRILLVDERSVYRMGLRSLIEASFPHAELLEASNLLQAFSQIKTEGYVDLVLIDLDLSRFHSLTPLKAACDASPATRWAIISAADTRADILACLAAGFHGFISKHQADDDILGAVTDLLSGRIYVPYSVAEASDASFGGEALPIISGEADLLKLTARQREVLSLIAHGMSNKEIARALHIAEATTKIHTAALLRALGVRNRTEAAFKAAKLIDTMDRFTPYHGNLGHGGAGPSSVRDDARLRTMRLKAGS